MMKRAYLILPIMFFIAIAYGCSKKEPYLPDRSPSEIALLQQEQPDEASSNAALGKDSM